MQTETNSPKKKRSLKKILLWIFGSLFIIITVVGVFLYYNFNRLLTDALTKSFNANIMSDVYELKFERLSVNFLVGDVTVHNVELQPRVKPLHNYPYINSSFRLKAAEMKLDNVELMTLIKSKVLKLDKIEIREPDVDLRLDGGNYILFPFKDTTAVAGPEKTNNKKALESFFLKEFALIDASFHVNNLAKEREFRIQKLNISLKDLMIDQHPGKDIIANKRIDFSVGRFTGSLKKRALKYIDFTDFKITIDSLNIQQNIDTAIYHYADFSTGLNKLDIQTADSIFHLTMEAFNLSYKEKSIKLKNVSFKPNISEAALQKRFPFKSLISGSFGTLNLLGVNFDSLAYKRKLFIDEIVLDKVSVNIFKDQRGPVDRNKIPKYLGQELQAIPMPLLIKQVKATNVNLVNREVTPKGDNGKANINRGTLIAKNITSLPSDKLLTLNADAYVENKAHVNVTLSFDYNKPQFGIDGTIKKFNLPDLNPLLQSYTPASIEKGIADEIAFSGNVYWTNASGTMKFLYHDLKVDLALKNKAKWMSSVLAFGANTFLAESNPGSADLPPRIVQYHFERDMTKPFIGMLIRSVLMGLKETMIMSKENKKTYKEEKKKLKEKNKKNKKDKKDKKA